ncbi:MAG: hypothetical protein AAF585_10790, partial [Verrucomicrobiota bacterium]
MHSFKHTLATFIALPLLFVVVLNADESVVSASNKNPRSIDLVWLGHRWNEPGKLVVNWMTEEPGDSIVRFGRTQSYGREIRVANNTRIHHVEIPLEESGGVYH